METGSTYRDKVAAAMRLSALAARLDAVRANGGFAPKVIDTFAAFLDSASDLQLFRMSPLRYATETKTDPDVAVDLFLHATHSGILDFSWGVICQQCGSFLNTVAGLRSLSHDKRCQLCAMDVQSSIDDNVEIAFTVSPTVRDIRFHHPERLTFKEDVLTCMFSRSVEFEPDFNTFIINAIRGSYKVPAGETVTIEFDLQEPRYTIIAPFDHLATYLTPTADGPADVVIELQTGQFVPDDLKVARGRNRVTVRNRTAKSAELGLMADVGSIPGADKFFANGRQPHRRLPFLTGKRLVTSQTFRDLFNTESIPAEGGLEFKNLTLLFTDLKGSTEMYRRIGDFRAYRLVRDHFAVLKRIVTASGGAVVKTIGDAIMASFADPAAALEAATKMRAEVSRVGGGEDLMLKIGIHSGPCIAVELNERLDYFGQTVNVAARVQSVAAAGEIVTTQAVYAAPRVRDVLSVAGLVVSSEKVPLKGVADDFSIYRLRPASDQVEAKSTAKPADRSRVDKAESLV